MLLAAKGLHNIEIAAQLGVMPRTAARWRERFLAKGVAGIEKDAPRAGRKPSIAAEIIQSIVTKTTMQQPVGATQWSTRRMVREVAVSEKTVRRTWKMHGLEPRLVKTFKYATHKHPKVQRWFARRGRFHMHFTPTSASWLNMVERFFRDLTVNRLRRGAFRSERN